MKYSIKQRPSFSSPHPRLYPVRVWFDKLTMTCTGGDFAAPAQRSFQRLQAIRSFIYPSSSAAFLNGVATRYFFANYELETSATEEMQIVYYYVNGAQIAQRKITATTDKLLYIHKDHLGSAVRLTDESGTVVQSLAYDPFGQTV